MLTQISTYGWFTEGTNKTDLTAVATYGWYGGIIVIDGDGRIGIFRELGDLFDGGMWG